MNISKYQTRHKQYTETKITWKKKFRNTYIKIRMKPKQNKNKVRINKLFSKKRSKWFEARIRMKL